VAKLDIEQISQEHYARIHRAALALSGNPWDADDLAQETFLVLSRQGERFEGRSNMYTWLYGILLNLDRRRRHRHGMQRRKLKIVGEQQLHRPMTASAADVPVEVEEWKRSLWSRVAQLPEGQRSALVLRFSGELQYGEIAEVLQCPLGTVKSRIYHGLRGLRELIQEEDYESLRQVPAEPNAVHLKIC